MPLTRAVIALSFVWSAAIADAAERREPLSVEEAIARHHELDGRIVEVRGWLTLCQRLSCHISSGADDSHGPYLSLGASRYFDRQTRRLIGRQIVVRARLDATCLHGLVDVHNADEEMIVCMDRASELRSPTLVRAAR